MSAQNPYNNLDFNDSEIALYKLLLRAAKTAVKDSSSDLHKVKVMDLVEISRYSKPKVYDIIKSLDEKGLIQIDNTRPMHVRPLDPKYALEKLARTKKETIETSTSEVLEDLLNLSELELEYPFSMNPPFSFFIGDKQYYNLMEELYNKAEEEIIMIVGFLVKVEEPLLKHILPEKIKNRLTVRILYGGSSAKLGHLMHSFDLKFIEPIKDLIQKHKDNLYLDGALYAPALRITIIDDKELVMVVKAYDEKDERSSIRSVSGIYSDHKDLIRTARDAYFMLRPIADLKIIQERLQNKSKKA